MTLGAALALIGLGGWWALSSPTEPADPTTAPQVEPSRVETPQAAVEMARKVVQPPPAPDPEPPPTKADPLSTTFAVTGRVVDAAEHGIGDATILLIRPGSPAEAAKAVCSTAADGLFHVPDVLPGSWIGATAVGHAPAKLHAVLTKDTPVVIRLDRPGISLAGFVSDLSGVRIADARVFVGSSPRSLTNAPTPQTMLTDKEGRFRLDGFEPGAAVTLWVRRQGYAVARSQVTVAANAPPIEIRLARGGTLRGRILDSSGAPVAGASAWFVADATADTTEAPYWVQRIASSDAAGLYSLDDQLPGAGRILASKTNSGNAERPVVVVSGVDTEVDLTLTTPNATAALTGVVVDVRGSPVANARVMILPDGDGDVVGARTGADGTFRIAKVSHGPARAQVSDGATCWPYPVKDVAVDLPLATLKLTLDYDARGGSFAFEVSPGTVSAAAVLELRRERELCKLPLQPSATGRVEVGLLPPGKYDVLLRDEQVGVVELGAVQVNPGERTDLGQVTLGAAKSLTVTLIGCQERVRGHLVSADGRTLHEADSDADTLTFSRVAPASYTIRLRSDTGLRFAAPVSVGAAATTTRLDLTGVSGTEITWPASGPPAGPTRLRLLSADRSICHWEEAISLVAAGRDTWRLAAGDYLVEVGQDGRVANTRFTVPTKSPVRIALP